MYIKLSFKLQQFKKVKKDMSAYSFSYRWLFT